MKKKNPFQEFIEGLPQLNGFDGDPIAKAVDEALTAWIVRHHPKDFEFDYRRKNLTVAMVKKSEQIIHLIEESPFKTYINAAIDMKWRKTYQKEIKKKDKADYYALLMEFASEVFSLGYALKSLENQKQEKKKEK